MFDDDRVSKHMATPFTGKAWDGHAPHTLPRETPVRPVVDHAEDSIAAIGWNPSNPLDFRQGFLPQFVGLHRHEPLLGRAKDHWIFTPPTVGIRMPERAMPEQAPVRLEILDNLRIGLQDLLSGELCDDRSKPSTVVHRCHNFKTLPC